MKKIFRTTFFWILVSILFWSYVRLFNAPLGMQVGQIFGATCPVYLSGWVVAPQLSGLEEQLTSIQTQLQDITQKMATSTSSSVSTTPSFVTTSPTKVALYYFNQREDAKLPLNQQVNVDSLLPVYRVLSPSQNIVFDTISSLLGGNLSLTEKSAGFVTDFPQTDFRLLNVNLQDDGTLLLEFTEVPGFTSWGSARMLILSNAIIKTAMQFAGVKKVQFMPDSLFQP